MPTDELEPVGEDEVFLHDLVGLTVVTISGEDIGTVIGYYDLSHGILLEIRRSTGTVLLPYRDEFVDAVDLGSGVLTINPPDGMFD